MIVRKLLPIKAHFFFFMAALGPILPQLQVFGKELGISSVIMGSVTGILPFAYLLAKPLFGIIVDIYRDCRKTIFISLIVIMAVSYGCIVFIPTRNLEIYEIQVKTLAKRCDNIVHNGTDLIEVDCYSECLEQPDKFHLLLHNSSNHTQNAIICDLFEQLEAEKLPCKFKCKESKEVPNSDLYQSTPFWLFLTMLSIGTIAFNVVNSISDAVCFDVIGDEYDYGKQRTWGSVGYGITALLGGYAMENLPENVGGYKPAICIMLIFIVLDLISCMKLELPLISAPKNIWKELRNLMKYNVVCIFLIFTILAGIADGFLTYFLLWYVEDISEQSNTKNVKILEGLIIAAQTLGGEILFFYVGDNILKSLGHIRCFSFCFISYGLRLGLISVVKSPWVIVVIEFFLQGPTYALTYLTIVAYANEIAPSGTSATMQGIAAGLDDGLGYALGSLLGGILYSYSGPRETFQIFSSLSVISGIIHFLIHKYCLGKNESVVQHEAKYVNVEQTCIT